MSSTIKPVWFIVAASSGFGHQIAREALARGHVVIATARNAQRVQGLAQAGALTMSFDVTSAPEAIESMVEQVYQQHGRVDYLINTAGYILEGSVEELSPQEVYDQFNTNVFGAMNTIRAFLPLMREQAMSSAGIRATIATFGSSQGWHGAPSISAYSMSKACASLLAESLQTELMPFNIRATAVEPGAFRTGFLSSNARVSAKRRIGAYEDENTPTGQLRRILGAVDSKQPGDVVKGSSVVVDMLTGMGIAKGKELPVRVVLGRDCDEAIRDECSQTLQTLDEWKDAARSTDHEQ